ncbi:MAG: polyprenyl synthetase family protein [Promethearchaeota archaeon]|nr:MAG: polyprenyl synthetase family protein [Candidatus Lokiarchaeota archaeon]
MNFFEYSKEYKSKINETIKDLFERKINFTENAFLNQYYSELKDYFLAGGKRIRPLLCIATYNAFKEKRDDKIIIPSVGTEFLHNASLIHDDIIDRDELRRGKPSFHYRYQQYYNQYKLKKIPKEEFGNSIGIIGGDSAFFIGMEPYFNNKFDKELNLRALKLYERAFIEIANGVLIETDMVHQIETTLDEYINMIRLKTGALIEKSILIGANYAEVDKKYNKLLSTYGLNLGIIFQIKDDILGTFGEEKKTGKPADSDIKEGKKTCLLIQALNKLNSKKKEKLLKIMNKNKISGDDVKIVRKFFNEVDVESSCKKVANDYYEDALAALNKLKNIINKEEAETFTHLLDFVMSREF